MSFQYIHSDTHTTFDIGSAPNEAFRGGENGALSAPSFPGNGGWDVEGEKKIFCEDMPFLGGDGASTGGGGMLKSIGGGSAVGGTEPAKKPLSAFLQKLRDIVDKSGSLCEWSASGDSLVVTDSSTFAVETLPQYFRTKNFSSFLRQLHFYGFRKTDRGNNAWEFSHAYFLKAKPELINKIQRKNSSSASSKGGSSGESMESKAQRETINHLQGRVDALEGMLNTFSDQMSRLLRVIGSSSTSLPFAPAPSGEFRETTSSDREMIKHTAAFARLRCLCVCVCVCVCERHLGMSVYSVVAMVKLVS